MKYQMSNVLIFSFIAIIFGFSFVFAQMGFPAISSLSGEDFSLDVSPDIPFPGAEVSASLASNSFDLDRSKITWIHNGKIVLEGTGKKQYQFKAGSLGREETIKAVVISPSGNKLEQVRSFILADVDLLWEAKTSRPVFYPGKALPVLRSKVKIVAEPHFILEGKRISPKNLIYKWFLGDELFQEQSGFGRQSFEFQIPIIAFQGQEARVEVGSSKQALKAVKTIFIPASEPKVLIYEEHPLQGPKFNRALAESFSATSQNQIDFRAEPYYFSSPSLVYNWFANGVAAKKEPPFNLLNLKISEGFLGDILLNLTVENNDNPLETKETNVKINVE